MQSHPKELNIWRLCPAPEGNAAGAGEWTSIWIGLSELRANCACAYRPSTLSPSPEWARSICGRRFGNILPLGRFEVEVVLHTPPCPQIKASSRARQRKREWVGGGSSKVSFTTRRLQNTDAECSLHSYPGCYKSRAPHAPTIDIILLAPGLETARAAPYT